MDVLEAYNFISSYNNDYCVNLYFTVKSKDPYLPYTTFSPNVSKEVTRELIDDSAKFIFDYFDFKNCGGTPTNEIRQVNFNPSGYVDGTVEKCTYDYVGNMNEVISSFDNRRVDNIENFIDSFSFYCIEILKGDQKARIFRRVTKFKKLSSKGLLAAFMGDGLNKISNKLLGLDGDVDILDFKQELLIFNHTSLERIFRISDKYSNLAVESINKLRVTNKISNFNQFEDDCLNDARVIKTLAKLADEDGIFDNCFSHFSNIINTIDLFNLDIETQTSPEEKIIYEGKAQLTDILRILSDSYYKSLIQGKTGIDQLRS